MTTTNDGSKTWVFTINNYTETDVNLMKAWAEEVSRITASKEVGEGGTPHIQGAVTFKNKKRLGGLKKLHARAHWAIALAADCFLYCMKEDSELIVNVNNTKQGKRSDIDEITDMIKAKKPKWEIAEKVPRGAFKYPKHIDMYAALLIKPRSEPPEVYWRWGATGTGKTRYVFDNHTDLWVSNRNLDWFDGYNGQEVALFEEFRGSNCDFHWLLRLLDRYPMQVPIKGSFVQWVPKIIYITTDRTPQQAYPGEPGIEQLLRRITRVDHIVLTSVLVTPLLESNNEFHSNSES